MSKKYNHFTPLNINLHLLWFIFFFLLKETDIVYPKECTQFHTTVSSI